MPPPHTPRRSLGGPPLALQAGQVPTVARARPPGCGGCRGSRHPPPQTPGRPRHSGKKGRCVWRRAGAGPRAGGAHPGGRPSPPAFPPSTPPPQPPRRRERSLPFLPRGVTRSPGRFGGARGRSRQGRPGDGGASESARGGARGGGRRGVGARAGPRPLLPAASSGPRTPASCAAQRPPSPPRTPIPRPPQPGVSGRVGPRA